MKNLMWSELHGHFTIKEIHLNEKNRIFCKYINEHVDYQLVYDLQIFEDGEHHIDIKDESIVLYNDEGRVVNSIPCKFSVKEKEKMKKEIINLI